MAFVISIERHTAISETSLGPQLVDYGQSKIFAQPDSGPKRHIGYVGDPARPDHKPHVSLIIPDASEKICTEVRSQLSKLVDFEIGDVIAPTGVQSVAVVSSQSSNASTEIDQDN